MDNNKQPVRITIFPEIGDTYVIELPLSVTGKNPDTIEAWITENVRFCDHWEPARP